MKLKHIILTLLISLSGVVSAKDFTVTRHDGNIELYWPIRQSGEDGSFIRVLDLVNNETTPGPHRILFGPNVVGKTILLSVGTIRELTNNNVTIDATGQNITIQRSVNYGPALKVSGNDNTIKELTFINNTNAIGAVSITGDRNKVIDVSIPNGGLYIGELDPTFDPAHFNVVSNSTVKTIGGSVVVNGNNNSFDQVDIKGVYIVGVFWPTNTKWDNNIISNSIIKGQKINSWDAESFIINGNNNTVTKTKVTGGEGGLIEGANNLFDSSSVHLDRQPVNSSAISIAGAISTSNTISNSIFTVNKANVTIDNANNVDGIRLFDGTTKNIITNNIVEGDFWNGILMRQKSSNNTVSKNIVKNNVNHGIFAFDNSNDNLITNNKTHNNAFSGISTHSSSGSIVTNNVSFNNSFNGIAFESNATNGIVKGNRVFSNVSGFGFVIDNSNNITVDSNYVGIDTLNKAAGNGSWGISLQNSSASIIIGKEKGNFISANTSGGIYIAKSSFNEVYNNLIGKINSSTLDNTFENRGPGIFMGEGSSSNIIGAANKGNTIGHKQNISGVIKVDGSSSTKNKIQSNSTFCNAGKGIELSNLGNNHFGKITNNKLEINRASTENNQILVTAPAGTKYYDIYIADTACSPTCSSDNAGVLTQQANSQGKIFKRRVDLSSLGTPNSLGDYTITLSGDERSHNIALTATDNNDNTSEFATCRHESLCNDPVVTNVNTTGDNNNGFCDGTSIDLTVSVNSNDVSYVWSLNNSPITNGTSNTLKVSESGTYVLTISDNADPATCKIDTSITVTKYDNPDLSVISGPNAACLDTDDKLTFSVKDLGPNHSYTWSHDGSVAGNVNSGDTSYTASNFNIQPTSKVTVSVVNDVTKCTDDATFDVTVNDNPNANVVTGDKSVQCGTKGVTYTASSNITDVKFIWTVSGPASIVGTANGDSSSVTIDFDDATNATGFDVNISVIAINKTTGCASDASTPLTVKLIGCNLNPDFTANTDACINTSLDNNSVTFSDLSTNGNGVKIVKWEWNFGADATPPSATDNIGNAGKGIDQTVTYSTTGKKTVTLTVTDEDGGIKTITKDDFITINDIPNISSISGPDAACLDVNDKQTYSVSDLGGNHTYTWSHDGSVQGTQNTGDTSYTASNFNKQPTSKVYLTVVNNTTGCSDSTNKDVTVNDNPIADIVTGNDKVQCGSTGISYTASSNLTSNVRYEWTITGPGSIASSNSDSSTVNIDFDNANSTTGYEVSIVVTAINTLTGCISSPSTPLKVQLIGCGLDANFNADTNACLNTSIDNNTHTFSDASSNDNGVKIVEWKWDFGTGATPKTVTDNTGDGNGKGLDQTVQYSTTGPKTITLTVTDENGGTNTIIKTDYLTVHNNPIISAISGPDNACFDTDDKLTYTVKSLGNNHTYTWSHDGSTQGIQNSGDTSYTASNFNKQPISKVYLTVKNDLLGCSDSTSKIVTVNDNPIADTVSGDKNVQCGTKGVTYTASSNITNVKYIWTVTGPGKIASANGADSSSVTIDFDQATSTTGFDVKISVIAVNVSTGCTSDPSTPLTVKLIGCGLKADFDSDTTLCLNTSLVNNEITFTDKSINIDGGAIVKWEWDFGTGAVPQTATDLVGNGSGKGLDQTVSYTNNGKKTISLTVTDEDGAVNTITKTDFLTVHSNPVTRVIDGDEKLCENTVGEYFIKNSDSTETYNWSAPNADKIVSTFKLDTATVKAASSDFNVNVNVVDSNGCSIAYAPFPVDVISEINSVDITKVPVFACTNDGRTLPYQLDAFTSGGGNANYIWNTTPALDTLVQKYGATYNDSTSQSLIMKFGTYTGNVTFNVKASPQDSTCKNEPVDFDQTIVYPSHPVYFSFTKPTTCKEDSAMHIVQVTWDGDNRPQPADTVTEVIGDYNWIKNTVDTISYSPQPLDAGRWTNSLNDTVNFRPNDNDTITVLPITGDTLVLSTSNLGFCYHYEKSKLTDTVIYNPIDRPDADLHIISKDTEKSINFDGSPQIDVNEFSFNDPLLKLPFVELKDKTRRFTNNGLIFTFENVISVDSFNTINRQLTTDFIDIVPTAQNKRSYTLTYKLSVDNGVCIDTSYARLNIEFDRFIPNAFTPNGDGVFDTWKIENLEKYDKVSVQIFNRWGSLVYENDTYDNQWEGLNQDGEKLPFGTYFYIVDFNIDGVKAVSGSVSIIK